MGLSGEACVDRARAVEGIAVCCEPTPVLLDLDVVGLDIWE